MLVVFFRVLKNHLLLTSVKFKSEYTSVVNCYKQEIRTLTIRTAHHTDLIAATKEQRRQEVDVIEKWISEYYSFFKTRRARKVKEQNNH